MYFKNKPAFHFPFLITICIMWASLIFGTLAAHAQGDADKSTKKKAKRPAYIGISTGLNVSSFRDFATSPLTYSGTPIYMALSHIELDEKRASFSTLSYSFGNYDADFNRQTSSSAVNTVTLCFSELFQLKRLSSPKLNLKAGAQLNATANIRDNAGLFNNSEGVEMISTLFGSMKATLNLSRKTQKDRQFLFIRYKAKERVRHLSYTMNIGIINSSYRNGFAYTNPSAPLHEDDFFAGYNFRIFQGFRVRSALDYTISLQNKNAIQFSYLWDAYRTGGHHDNFEMAAHIFKCSLLYSLK